MLKISNRMIRLVFPPPTLIRFNQNLDDVSLELAHRTRLNKNGLRFALCRHIGIYHIVAEWVIKIHMHEPPVITLHSLNCCEIKKAVKKKRHCSIMTGCLCCTAIAGVPWSTCVFAHNCAPRKIGQNSSHLLTYEFALVSLAFAHYLCQFYFETC